MGRKYKLDGTSDAEIARMDVIYDQMQDLLTALLDVVMPPQSANGKEIHDKKRKEYVAALDGKLAAIAKFLGTNEWMAGKRLTYVDFSVYDILDLQRCLFLPKHLNKFPTLMAYMNRMEGLKGVKEYLKSDTFKRTPAFAPFALLGSTPDFKPLE